MTNFTGRKMPDDIDYRGSSKEVILLSLSERNQFEHTVISDVADTFIRTKYFYIGIYFYSKF